MKSVFLAIFAVILYAVQHVYMEQKLARYDVFGLLVYFYTAMFPLAILGLAYQKMTGQEIVMPEGGMVLVVIMVGVVYFIADACLVGAYTSGGSLMTIATIIAMFPVVSSAIKYAWVREPPNLYQTIGYIMAFLAVCFVAKGSPQ